MRWQSRTTADAKEIEKESAEAATLYNWAGLSQEGWLRNASDCGCASHSPQGGSAVDGRGEGAQPRRGDRLHAQHGLSHQGASRSLASLRPLEQRQAQPSSEAAATDPLGPRDPKHPLPNRDLDTGQVVKPGGYRLTDETYAELLHRLTRDPNQPIPPGIKSDVEAYYSRPQRPDLDQAAPPRMAEGAGGPEDAGCDADKRRARALPHLRAR